MSSKARRQFLKEQHAKQPGTTLKALMDSGRMTAHPYEDTYITVEEEERLYRTDPRLKPYLAEYLASKGKSENPEDEGSPAPGAR